MDLELSGKRAVVTGGSRGIGLAIVRALVSEGVYVVSGSRQVSTELQTLVDQGKAEAVTGDLGTIDGVTALAETALGAGPVHLLVNNVGFDRLALGGFLEVTEEHWQESLGLNFLSAVRMCRAVLPRMVETGGAIVNVSSVNSTLPDTQIAAYSASKAAMDSLSKALSLEFGPKGVRVNTVNPGMVTTDLWMKELAVTIGEATGRTPEEVAASAAVSAATGRFSEPEEIADMVVFLLSARAANVTGGRFLVDGGVSPQV